MKNIYYVLNPNNKQPIKRKQAAVKQPPLQKANLPPTTAKQNVLTRPMTSPAIAQGAHDRSLDNANSTNNDVKMKLLQTDNSPNLLRQGCFQILQTNIKK